MRFSLAKNTNFGPNNYLGLMSLTKYIIVLNAKLNIQNNIIFIKFKYCPKFCFWIIHYHKF